MGWGVQIRNILLMKIYAHPFQSCKLLSHSQNAVLTGVSPMESDDIWDSYGEITFLTDIYIQKEYTPEGCVGVNFHYIQQISTWTAVM